jgi:hypothetical protein
MRRTTWTSGTRGLWVGLLVGGSAVAAVLLAAGTPRPAARQPLDARTTSCPQLPTSLSTTSRPSAPVAPNAVVRTERDLVELGQERALRRQRAEPEPSYAVAVDSPDVPIAPMQAAAVLDSDVALAARDEAEREVQHAERVARMLTADDPALRAEAVFETPAIAEGAGRLQQVLEHDPHPEVRADAAFQLGHGEGYATVKSLVAALDDDDLRVAIEAAKSLGSMQDASVIPELERAGERRSDADFAAALAEAITQLGASRRRTPTRALFKEEAAALAARETTPSRATAQAE